MIRFYFFIHSRKLPLSCGISILGLIFIHLFFHCLILKVLFCSIGQFSFFKLLLIKLLDIQENVFVFFFNIFFVRFGLLCVNICECIYVYDVDVFCISLFDYSEYCQNKKVHRCKKSKIEWNK